MIFILFNVLAFDIIKRVTYKPPEREVFILKGDCYMAKYIFVTGGVSSLGKGITASAIGQLLKSRGLKVFMQKLILI